MVEPCKGERGPSSHPVPLIFQQLLLAHRARASTFTCRRESWRWEMAEGRERLNLARMRVILSSDPVSLMLIRSSHTQGRPSAYSRRKIFGEWGKLGPGRGECDPLLRARVSDIGQLLLPYGIDFQVVLSGVFSDDHAFVHLCLWLHEQRTSGL
jgi:hypothetical protein